MRQVPQFEVAQRVDGKFNVWKRFGAQPWFIIRVFDTEIAALSYVNRLLKTWRRVAHV